MTYILLYFSKYVEGGMLHLLKKKICKIFSFFVIPIDYKDINAFHTTTKLIATLCYRRYSCCNFYIFLSLSPLDFITCMKTALLIKKDNRFFF